MERGEQKLRGKVSDEKGKGMGNWLETKKQLTVTASDFVTQFSACPALHVKQIFIAVFYLHFWFSDHDFFLARFLTECNFFYFLARNLLCRSFWCRRLEWSIFYYLAFHFVAVGNEIFLHIKNILTSCCDNVFTLFMWQIHLLPSLLAFLSSFFILLILFRYIHFRHVVI